MADRGGCLKYHVLYSSPIVQITDVVCAARPSRGDLTEQTSRDEIVFPRSGTYIKHLGRHEVLADPNRVVFFNRSAQYRVTHPVEGGDVSTSLTFPRAILREALAQDESVPGLRPVFRLDECAAGNGLSLTLQDLRGRLLAGLSGGLQVDETCLGLLQAIAAESRRRLDMRSPRLSPAAVRRRKEIVKTAQVVLGRSFRESPSLAGVAREAGCSPFHLARVFRQETRVPVHRYLDRLRLRESLERLCSGESDLTALGLDLGYSSHSHFTDSFRRVFGMSPSQFRGSLRTSPRCPSSKIPEA